MAKISRDVEDIDEAALLQSIYEQDNPVAVSDKGSVESVPEQVEMPKVDKGVRRKRGNVDYSSMFLQRNALKVRSCVYISQRIHATISEIVRVIADRDVSVGGYIDNVLLQHLEAHKDEINDLYKRERTDLIAF
jgi:hypothetical protein